MPPNTTAAGENSTAGVNGSATNASGSVNISANGTGTGSVGNATGSGAGGGGGGGWGGGGGGWFESIPGPADFVWGIGDVAIDLLFGAFLWFLRAFNENGIGTPYPKNSGPHGIFGEPTGAYAPHYNGIIRDILFKILPDVIVIMALAAIGLYVAGSAYRRYQATQLLWFVFVGMAAAAFVWPYVTLLHMGNHAGTMLFAPSAGELTSTWGSLIKTLTGQLAVLAGLAFLGWLEGAALVLMYAGRQAFLHIGPVIFYCLALVAFLAPFQWIRLMAWLGIIQYHIIVFWTWPAVFGLRLAHEMHWSVSANGLWNAIIMLAIIFLITVAPIFMSFAGLLVPLALAFSSRAQGAMANLQSRLDDSDDDSDDPMGGGGGGGDPPDPPGGGGGARRRRRNHNQWDLGKRVAADGSGAAADPGGVGLTTNSTGSSSGSGGTNQMRSAPRRGASTTLPSLSNSSETGAGSIRASFSDYYADESSHTHAETVREDVDRQWSDRERAYREWSQ